MSDPETWQCADCGTLVDPETRKCGNCGGINFYPLADEVPGEENGTVETDGDLDRALNRLSEEDA